MLTITSLLSILLFSFHLADDIVRGMEFGGVQDLIARAVEPEWAESRWFTVKGPSRRVRKSWLMFP